MKVIFLDFDGVLNHENWYERRYKSIKSGECEASTESDIDPESVENLNYIIRETGAKVVVSSTWRLGHTTEELGNILKECGFVGEVIDKTPRIIYKHNDSTYVIDRGVEIKHWLKDKGFQRINWSKDRQKEWIDKSDVENYVILDDDSDMLYGQREHFILVSRKFGLTKEIANKCIDILNKSVLDLYYEEN